LNLYESVMIWCNLQSLCWICRNSNGITSAGVFHAEICNFWPIYLENDISCC